MDEKRKCLRCGSTNTTPSDLQSTGKIYIRPKDAKLSAVLKSGVPVDAVICLDCGHIELITNPAEAKNLVKKS
jgi:predicted nucleic-acid-binding Zn-ribbon protein